MEPAAGCTYSAALSGDAVDEPFTLAPNQTVSKSWSLLNDGACDWTDVRLVFVTASAQEEGSPVPATGVGLSVELAIDLTAPSTAGHYNGEWRLRAPDGTFFGPSLRAEMFVQATDGVPTQSAYGAIAEAGCVLDAAFLEDVTLPDGTVVQPNQALHKTWRIRNTGTCDWELGASLVFVSGSLMSATNTVLIPPTRSGETADIVVNLTAPAENGSYTGLWRLQSTDGTLFGTLLFVAINVGEPSALNAGGPAASNNPPPSPYAPFIHNISYHSRQIFLDGQAKGNRRNIFTKVGDSITDVPAFLNPIGDGVYVLHEYGYLQPAINYFSEAPVRNGNSFNNKSVAAVWGWSTWGVLEPNNVRDVCPGMTPVACEYSIVKPSVAIILIGTNDMLSGTHPAIYEGNLRQIIDTSIEYGVIPVLSTLPWDQFGDVQPYNQVIVATAVAYDIPWMDFYSATWELDNHGISWEDGVHPSVPSTNDPTNFTEGNLHYGHTVRNLLVMNVLDAIWRQVLAY